MTSMLRIAGSALLVLALVACNRQGPEVPKGVDDNKEVVDQGDGIESVMVRPDAAKVGSEANEAGDILTVEFTVCGIPCLGLNGGPQFKHSCAFSFQIATDTQEETDRYWNAIIDNGGEASECGWCQDRWGLSWQITPRVLTEAFTAGGEEAKRAFTAMMEMGKIDIAKIEAARRG